MVKGLSQHLVFQIFFVTGDAGLRRLTINLETWKTYVLLLHMGPFLGIWNFFILEKRQPKRDVMRGIQNMHGLESTQLLSFTK